MSHMTIRRDVSKLEEQGLLVSVSGGVRAVSRLAAEPSHLVKSTLQSEGETGDRRAGGESYRQKQLHLSGCRDYHPGAGAGDPRPERSPVVTNDFEITQLLIDASQCGVIHTGGTLCRENRSCVGESAARTLRHPGYRYGLYLRQRLGQSRDFHPDENKVTVKETVSQSAREASCCATVRNTIRWPRSWRYL